MRYFITLILCSFFVVINANAEVIQTDIETALLIKPGETKEITTKPDENNKAEIFWQTLAPEECQSTACVKFTDKASNLSYESFNGQGAFSEQDGKVTLSFTNISTKPVTINIKQITKTCTAEICKLIQTTETQNWKVVRIQKLKTIETSKDGSYSSLQGITTKGKEFDITLVWWFYEPSTFMNCEKNVTKWIEKPNPKYGPYVLSGSTLKATDKLGTDRFVLFVDGCTPRGKNYSAPKESEY